MLFKNYTYIFVIIFYSFSINWYSANIGVFHIDTFGFFDTGYNILNGQLPIRDYWAYTGLIVDYFQSFFFLIFGSNWNSYVIHGSIINVLATLVFYFFLKHLKISKNFCLFYSLSFATLHYPVSGTPYAYLHAYTFSLIGIMLFFILNNTKQNKLLFFVPLIFFLAFFSMQTPTIYIILLTIVFVIFSTIRDKDYIILKQFVIGTFIIIILLIAYLLLSKTNFIDFLYQYFLFPLTIAESRVSSDAGAYVKLIDQLNFKRIFGDFKFIHLFLIPLIYIQIMKFKEKKIDYIFFISIFFIVGTMLFIYNQLLQANQIYIFSLIPILASLLHKNLKFDDNNKKLVCLGTIFLILFVSIKFHIRFNIDRKFIDLENIDKKKSVNASEIHKKFNNLKWVSPYTDPEEDKLFISKVIDTLDNENEKSYIITHYNFFSTILDKNFFILNRWYMWDNNSHPTENHKYFSYYKNFVIENLIRKDIKKIYLINETEEMKFSNIKNYFGERCFDQTNIIGEKFVKLTLKRCI